MKEQLPDLEIANDPERRRIGTTEMHEALGALQEIRTQLRGLRQLAGARLGCRREDEMLLELLTPMWDNVNSVESHLIARFWQDSKAADTAPYDVESEQ